MGTFKFVPKEIKEQILRRIKEEGVTVSQAAADAGISSKTIYNWMRSKTLSDGSILEISRLKREDCGCISQPPGHCLSQSARKVPVFSIISLLSGLR